MAISKKLLTVLAGLVLMTVLLLQCDLDAQAANHNYLSDYTGGAAAVLDARSTNTSKVLNATAKELNLDLDSLSREEESTLVMANVTSALNVRTEPATDAEKAGKLYKDCGGKILERKDGWTKIQSGDLIGWASDEYLLFGEDAESLAADVGVTVAHIDDGLMVRTKPGTDADIYGVLPKGDEVEVLSVGDDGWACIDYEGEDGYVSTDYITIEFKIDEGETMEAIKERQAAEAEAKRHVNYGQYTTDADTTLLLAALIQCEAGGEGENGMKAVASVVMNRVRSTGGEYARVGQGSIRKIIFQPGQFVCASETERGSYNPQNIYNMRPTDIHYEIADWAIAGNRLHGLGTALWFFNPFSPSCRANFPSNVGTFVMRIGDHCFYNPTAAYYDT